MQGGGWGDGRRPQPKRGGAAMSDTVLTTMRRLALPAAAVCLMAVMPAQANNWVLDPTLRLSAGINDNVRLRQNGASESYQSTVAVGAVAQRATQLSRILATLELGYTNYTGSDDLPADGDFQTLRINSNRRMERTLFEFDVRLARDNALIDTSLPFVSPDEEIDLGDDFGDDIDVDGVQQQVKRHRVVLAPSVTHELGQRITVGAGYTGTLIDYDETDVNRQQSLTHEMVVRSDYLFSERSSVGLGLQAGLFRPENSVDDIDTVGVVLDWRYALSMRTTLELSGGLRRSEVQETGEKSTGFTGQAGLDHQGEDWRTYASLDRRLRPSGRGVLTETDQLLFGGTRDLSPRVALSMNARAFKSRVVGDREDLTLTERFVNLEPGLTYRLTEQWRVTAQYRYRAIQRAQEASRAESNAVFLNLEFRPRREVMGF